MGIPIPDDIKKHIDTWIEVFFPAIRSLIEKDPDRKTKPVIVQISRKMPRFLDWILNQYMDETKRKDCLDILGQCELVTEHALPFILSELGWNEKEGMNSKPNEKRPVILLDDSSVSGSTLVDLTLDLDFVMGITPLMSVIFLCEDSAIVELFKESIIGFESIEMVKGLDDKDNRDIVDCVSFVCDCNLATSLPIDMEFPILIDFGLATTTSKLFSEDVNHAVEKLKEASSNAKRELDGQFETENTIYSIKGDKDKSSVDSISIVLNDEFQYGYNNDFAKVRIFWDRINKISKFVAYCPNILCSDELYDSTLFKNPYYAEVWNKIIKALPSGLNARPITDSSMVIAANYLYSLSCLIRNKQLLLIDSLASLTIELKDLILIFGETLAKGIFDLIRYIIINGEISPTKHGRYWTLPTRIVSEDFESSYTIQATRILSERWGKGVSSTLDGIFLLSHFKDNELYIPDEDSYWMGIYETVTSLVALLKPFHQNEILEKEVHEWLDTRIDEGMIVPSYQCVMADDRMYWMRFFTLAANAELL